MLTEPVRGARSSRRLRRLVSRLLPLAIIAGALTAVAPPADAAVGTCTIFWKGTTSTAWETSTNWSLTDGGANAGRLPTTTDVACRSTVQSNPDVVIASNRAVAGMNFGTNTGTGSLTLTGGNLTLGSVANGAFDSTIRNLRSPSGFVMGGTAPVTLTGPGDPVNAGTYSFAGTGPVSLATGATLNVANATVNGAKTFTNSGTLSLACGNLQIATGSKVDNAGTINVPSTCSGISPFSTDGSAGTKFTNKATGVLNLSGTVYVDSSAIPWQNDGQVNAAVPDLYFKTSAGSTGGYNISAGTNVHEYGVLQVSPGSVTGAGKLVLDVGTLSGSGGSVPHLLVSGGALTGSFSSPDSTWTSATATGPGSFTVPSGGTADVTSAQLANGYSFTNQGTLRVCGSMTISDTSKLDNFGTANLTTYPGCASQVSFTYSTTPGQVVNEPAAVMNMSAASYVDLSSIVFHNNGQVNSSTTDAYVVPAATDTGSYNITAGVLHQYGGNLTVSAGTVTGAGILDQTFGTLTGAGGNVPHLKASGGTVTGDLSSDDVSMVGSQFTGPGRLTVNAGGTASLPSGVGLANGYDLENHGTMTVSSSLFGQDDNSIVDNYGSLLVGSGTAIFDSSAGATFQLINRAVGTITATCATTTESVYLQRLSNSGTLETNKCDVTVTADSDLSGAGALTGSGTLKATTGQLRLDRSITSNASTLVLGATGTFFDASAGAATALTALASNSGTLVLNRTLNTTVAMANSGTVNVVAGTFRPTSYTQSAGSTVVSSGAFLRGAAAGTGPVAINFGSLTGGGGIQAPLTVAGVIQPGGQGTAMAVTGTYAQTGAATFGETITGPTTPGTDFSKLTVSSTAALNGTLAITTSPSYDPAVGATFRILDASGRSGTFSNVSGIALPNNKYYNVVYDVTGVSLVVALDPQASVGNAAIAEGNTGTSLATVAVTLDQASTRTVTYDYTTVDQTATAGSDYVTSSGTLTFAPGETTKNVSVTVNGDATFEPSETLLVRLSNPVNGTVLANDGGLTITNDDASAIGPTVTAVSPSTVGQQASGRAITISGSDFAPTSTVTFNKTGVTVVAGSLVVVNSNTITLKINTGKNVPLGPTNVTVTTPAGSATCTGCLTVVIKPTVTSTSPLFLGLGAKIREVTVHGTDFQPGARLTITGTNVVSTSYIDSTTLEAVVSPQTTAVVGPTTLTVTNPDVGRDVCTICFSLVTPPSITGATPSALHRGTTVDITLTGANLAPGAKLAGPTGVVVNTVRVLDANTMTATVSVAANAPLGTGKKFTVTNPSSAGYGIGTFLGASVVS